MIDNVCLHAAKQDDARAHHQKIIQNFEDIGDEPQAKK